MNEQRFTSWLKTAPAGSTLTVWVGPAGTAPGWLRKYHDATTFCLFHEQVRRMKGQSDRYEYAYTAQKISQRTFEALENLRYSEAAPSIHDKRTWENVR